MASGGTIIIYGGMAFYNVLTRSFNQEIVFDDSDTDQIANKFTISATVFIHGLASARMGALPTAGTGDAGAQLAGLEYLFAPRQHFEYRVGVTFDSFGNLSSPGAGLVVCDPANIVGNTNINFRDVKNGPRAKVSNVTRIASDAFIKADVDFEIWMVNCAGDGSTANGSGVLNNRWSVVDDIDRNFMTTRTFTGKLRCSSAQVNANNFRSLVVPPLQPGMRREHMQFAVSEDGLNLMYNITDKEVAFAPPAPATTWNARFGERRAWQDQIGYFSDAEITLGGDRNVDKQKLFAIAASMALSKFQNGFRVPGNGGNNYFVQSVDMIDEYGDDGSFVHFRATARRVDDTGPGLLGVPTKNLGVPIGSANEIADVVANYDYRFSRDSRPGDVIEVNGPISLVGAFAAYLQGPCQINFAIANGVQGQAGATPQQTSLPTVTAVVNNGIASDQTISVPWGADNEQGMYTFSEMEVSIEIDPNRAQMPIASTGTGSSSQFSLGNDPYWNGSPPAPSAGDTAAIVDLAPPVAEKEIIIASERIGQPPAAPAPQDHTDSNGVKWKVWASHVIIKADPKITSDGKKIFRRATRIIYKATGIFIDAVTSAPFKIIGLAPWSSTRNPEQDIPVENLPQ